MIDGTGMCGGCRVKVGDEYLHACVDGPDFDGHLVDFDDAMRRGVMYRAYEGTARKAMEKQLASEARDCDKALRAARADGSAGDDARGEQLKRTAHIELDPDMEAKLAAMDPDKAARVRAALEAKAAREGAARAAERAEAAGAASSGTYEEEGE